MKNLFKSMPWAIASLLLLLSCNKQETVKILEDKIDINTVSNPANMWNYEGQLYTYYINAIKAKDSTKKPKPPPKPDIGDWDVSKLPMKGSGNGYWDIGEVAAFIDDIGDWDVSKYVLFVDTVSKQPDVQQLPYKFDLKEVVEKKYGTIHGIITKHAVRRWQ